jgi:hypothetical protein
MVFSNSVLIPWIFIKTALAVTRDACYLIYSLLMLYGGEPTALAGKALFPTLVGVRLSASFWSRSCLSPRLLGCPFLSLNSKRFDSS